MTTALAAELAAESGKHIRQSELAGPQLIHLDRVREIAKIQALSTPCFGSIGLLTGPRSKAQAGV